MPRQGKNIYLRKDGRWEGRYQKERVNGKIKYGSVFGKTYEEAEQKLEILKAKSNSPALTSSLTFECVSADWLNTQKPQLKVSSYSKYSNILRLYLVPSFGDNSVQSITRSEVLQFSRQLLTEGGVDRDGLAPKTVNSIISVLKNVLDYANSELNVAVSAIGNISIRQIQKPMRILSRYEQTILSRYLCDNLTPCNLGILLCLYTGMRIGEVCALTWDDIHIDEQYLYVHKSMQRIQTDDRSEKKTKVVVQTPKSNCSVRKIPIPEEMLQLLILSRKQDDAFLLTGMAHTFIEPRCLENQFKSATNACGIPEVNFHALRHTFATRCVELGFDIKSLSEILGHASVNITLNRYVHPSMELKQENMNRLSAFLTTG